MLGAYCGRRLQLSCDARGRLGNAARHTRPGLRGVVAGDGSDGCYGGPTDEGWVNVTDRALLWLGCLGALMCSYGFPRGWGLATAALSQGFD